MDSNSRFSSICTAVSSSGTVIISHTDVKLSIDSSILIAMFRDLLSSETTTPTFTGSSSPE